MAHRLCTLFVITVALVAVGSVIGHAQEHRISGTVTQMDRQQGIITISPEDGGLIEVQVPAALLAHLQNGDAVEVRLSQGRIVELHQKKRQQEPTRNQVPRLAPETTQPSR